MLEKIDIGYRFYSLLYEKEKNEVYFYHLSEYLFGTNKAHEFFNFMEDCWYVSKNLRTQVNMELCHVIFMDGSWIEENRLKGICDLDIQVDFCNNEFTVKVKDGYKKNSKIWEAASWYGIREAIFGYLKHNKGDAMDICKLSKLFPSTEDACLVNKYFGSSLDNDVIRLLLEGKQNLLLEEAKKRESEAVKINNTK